MGVIGKPSDWLISSIPDYDNVYKKLNYKLIDIPISKLVEYFNEADINNYSETNNLKFDESELAKAKKVYIALDRIKEEYQLSFLEKIVDYSEGRYSYNFQEDKNFDYLFE